ncbi:hybrid sensor histidine kinase/response regulator [Acinetobacter boissieri]|uniref:Chemotaxis protein CheA n=1 Tax=Acinetobacter boissieri TaxID=1219383 RepID=A0A1G6HYA2_9GAMM|nr:Hpt domain-containing protein [Acinetobacter boissieri]SDB99289.1 chemosensory pili system protein ChpA (sensor histidine kinase/response regulator) [Acinetobacter boissieri]
MNEFVQRLVQDIAVPADTYLQQDTEIVEIFAEEAEEIIVELTELFVQWQQDLHAFEALTVIRRHFHTLKGSGRMVGANQMGEFAWGIEELLNSVLQEHILLTEDIKQYTLSSFDFYQKQLLPSIQHIEPLTCDIRPFLYVAKALKEQQTVDAQIWQIITASDVNTETIPGDDLTAEEISTALPETVEEDTVSSTISIMVDIPSVYLDEMAEHLEKVRHYLNNNEPSIKDTTGLIRAIHTLKGSSSMMNVDDLVFASGNVEVSLNLELQEKGQLDLSLNLLEQFEIFLSQYLLGLRATDASLITSSLKQFKTVWQQYEEYIKHSEQEQIRINDIIALNIDHLLGVADDFDLKVWRDAESYLTELIDESEILIQWADSKNLVDLADYVIKLRQAYMILLAVAFSDYDALKIQSIAFDDFHNALMIYFDFLASGQINPVLLQHQDELDVLINTLSEIRSNAEQPLVIPAPDIPVAQIIKKIECDEFNLSQCSANVLDDTELVDIFVEEAEEIVAQMDSDLSEFESNPIQLITLKKLMRNLHTLKGSANMIQAVNLGTIAHHLESVYELLIHQKREATPLLLAILRCIHDKLAGRTDAIRDQGLDFNATHTLALLESCKQIGENYDFTLDTTSEAIIEDHDKISKSSDQENLATEKPAYIRHTPQSMALLDVTQNAFHAWCEDRSSRSLLLAVQRGMYALDHDAKQIVDAKQLQDLTALLVDFFEQYTIYQIQTDIHDDNINMAFDRISAYFNQNIDLSALEKVRQAIEKIKFTSFSSTGRTESVEQMAQAVDDVQGDGATPPSMHGLWQDQSDATITQEMLRVSAVTIDKVTNLTAESAINRSRVEMGLNQFSTTLSEMELAIVRLSEQLRRMEGELETQILAKHGTEHDYQDFDPLEMDQYSALNQLSKSLAESASDLLDFKSTLSDKITDSETLLLEQARMQTDVQDNLLRVRQVGFSLIESRLQRLVRQTAMSVNRSVELEIINSRLEIDRSILDRLVSPLEHMLRNSIDHGIESTRERLQKEKPKVGKVSITLTRQGTDILLDIKDDGRGIDVNQIRRKAEGLGLITEYEKMADEDILQFIFSSGFSTAEQLTQLSGRGVGLDVVKNDIRTLGGHISVTSVKGQGAQFTIRIPTIMTVADALMVKVSEQQFAIPLSQIDRITMMPSEALQNYFNSDEESLQIDGRDCRLRYLSEFLGYAKKPSFGITENFPIIMVRGYNNQLVALLVDQLVGSRVEIVVKPLNNTLKHIQTLGGATILGDGRVCFILDAQNIARSAQNTMRYSPVSDHLNYDDKQDLRHTVMIVDDSVTVRKVTSRILERHGYDIVTAKDGLDAMEKLETFNPDIMLLDIEMPRMDGFEVANLVRSDAVHHGLPIIMITSRTGLKHRERAISLGVNHYMGKPFQEDNLLAQIEKVLHDLKGDSHGR